MSVQIMFICVGFDGQPGVYCINTCMWTTKIIVVQQTCGKHRAKPLRDLDLIYGLYVCYVHMYVHRCVRSAASALLVQEATTCAPFARF